MILAVAIILSTTLKFASSLNLNTGIQDAFAKLNQITLPRDYHNINLGQSKEVFSEDGVLNLLATMLHCHLT